MKDKCEKCIVTIIVFLALYSPPIHGIHSLYFVTLISYIYIILNLNNINVYLKTNRLKAIFFVFLFMSVWIVSKVLLNDGTRGTMVQYIYLLLSYYPSCIALVIYSNKKHQNILEVFNYIFAAGLIQSILSILAFLNSTVKQLFINVLQSDGTIDISHYSIPELQTRFFGLAAGLTFDMPVIQSIIAMIVLYLAINKDVKYFLLFPTIAFSAIINARTSIVIFAAGILSMILVNKEISSRHLMRIILVFGGSVVGLLLIIAFLNMYSESTAKWIFSGVDQILSFMHGEETKRGYFGYITSENRWALPSGSGLVFGKGFRIMSKNPFGHYSDIGYINDIWLGGIVYSIIAYSLMLIALLSMWRNNRYNKYYKINKYISLMLFVSLPLLNIKTYFIMSGSAFKFVIFLLLFFQLYNISNYDSYLVRMAIQNAKVRRI